MKFYNAKIENNLTQDVVLTYSINHPCTFVFCLCAQVCPLGGYEKYSEQLFNNWINQSLVGVLFVAAACVRK